jgi:hypothetical protein
MSNKYKKVNSKKDMFKRLQAGEFGNHVRMWSWPHYTDAYMNGERLPEAMGLRCTLPNVPFLCPLRSYHEVKDAISQHYERGLGTERFVISEACPDDLLTIQGDYVEDPYVETPTPTLAFSTVKGLTNRQASANFNTAKGLSARIILQDYLEPDDYDWLVTLSKRYPAHVIEFSNFSVQLGNLQRHMVIWEVRNY